MIISRKALGAFFKRAAPGAGTSRDPAGCFRARLSVPWTLCVSCITGRPAPRPSPLRRSFCTGLKSRGLRSGGLRRSHPVRCLPPRVRALRLFLAYLAQPGFAQQPYAAGAQEGDFAVPAEGRGCCIVFYMAVFER